MGMTQTQKILARAANLDSVKAGQLIQCSLSLVMGNDITAPVAINEFEKVGAAKVFDNTKIALIPDHFTPNKDIKSAQQAKRMRDFAKKYEIQHYYEVGRAGIEHALLPELGLWPGRRDHRRGQPTPAPTARWGPFPPAWAPRIWLRA